jgi:hypothetical protein
MIWTFEDFLTLIRVALGKIGQLFLNPKIMRLFIKGPAKTFLRLSL